MLVLILVLVPIPDSGVFIDTQYWCLCIATYFRDLSVKWPFATWIHFLLSLVFLLRLLPPALPEFSLLPRLIADSFAVAIVGFSMGISLSKIFALKHGYSVDGNQVSRSPRSTFYCNVQCELFLGEPAWQCVPYLLNYCQMDFLKNGGTRWQLTRIKTLIITTYWTTTD